MANKYLVTFRRQYVHRVVVGVDAPSKKTALQMATAVYESTTESDVADIEGYYQLLYDNVEDAEDRAFSIQIQPVEEFPKPMAGIVRHG